MLRALPGAKGAGAAGCCSPSVGISSWLTQEVHRASLPLPKIGVVGFFCFIFFFPLKPPLDVGS